MSRGTREALEALPAYEENEDVFQQREAGTKTGDGEGMRFTIGEEEGEGRGGGY